MGHHVFTDNFYSSPHLFRQLAKENIGACGTVKAGRQGMPAILHPSNLLLTKHDPPVFARSGNLVACAWHDTKRVNFLSSMHNDLTMEKSVRSKGAEGGVRQVEKPVMGEMYNKYMGGVDLLDQKLGTFAFPHKVIKRYHAVYHRLREVAMVNAYIIYTISTKEKGLRVLSPRSFRQAVIEGLLRDHSRKVSKAGRPSLNIGTHHLTERHFPARFGDPKHKPDCIVCSDRHKVGWKRVQTNYQCKQCVKAMCPVPCFELYHTISDYRKAAGCLVHNVQ